MALVSENTYGVASEIISFRRVGTVFVSELSCNAIIYEPLFRLTFEIPTVPVPEASTPVENCTISYSGLPTSAVEEALIGI